MNINNNGCTIISFTNGIITYEETTSKFLYRASVQNLVNKYMRQDSVLCEKIKTEYPEYFV